MTENKSNVDTIGPLTDIENFKEFLSRKMSEDNTEAYDVPDGMARSIWENKYSRVLSTYKKPNGTIEREFQTWEQRLKEVVGGNLLLDYDTTGSTYGFSSTMGDIKELWGMAKKGVLPFAGRHLQHGDWDQPNKNLEKLCNCATAISTFMQFKLGLDGCGIGADYSTAIRRVNWDNAPYIRVVLSHTHPDFHKRQGLMSLEDAKEIYPSESENIRWFDVEDSCEGWVRAVAAIETAAFHEKHREKLFIFNFTPVRCEGTPIRGQQGRPASGPIPLMEAFENISRLRGANLPPWKQAIWIDHYLASCIVLGGIRRMARIACKYWKDNDIFDFISIKRGGNLWSANNSILVDKQFWSEAKDPRTHAARVLQAATAALFHDQSGEPGFINVDMLHQPTEEEKNEIDPAQVLNKDYYDTPFHEKTYEMVTKLTTYALKQPYFVIINPCAEIAISTFGGFCLVSETNMALCDNPEEFIKAAGVNAKFLCRVNKMKTIYKQETERTNRIGVSILGLHEGAYKFFGLTFRDMIADFDKIIDVPVSELRNSEEFKNLKSLPYWVMLDDGREEAELQSENYSKQNGLNIPATVTTLKPGGTVSKVMQTTECGNLPAFSTYIRWVQYETEENGKPNDKLTELIDMGYPYKDISIKDDGSVGYPGKTVVGFPTKLPIVDLMGDEVTCSTDISVEEHFKWLMLLEKFWLGLNEDGSTRNNQVSYTLKISKKEYSDYADFSNIIQEWQPKIRCCAMDFVQDPEEMKSVYAYAPEEPISLERYEELMSGIKKVEKEEYDNDQLQCASGICPIEPDQHFSDEEALEEA